MDDFSYYSKGVYNNPSCPNSVNHGVVVVGYGTSQALGDFWIVRNSWGKSSSFIAEEVI